MQKFVRDELLHSAAVVHTGQHRTHTMSNALNHLFLLLMLGIVSGRCMLKREREHKKRDILLRDAVVDPNDQFDYDQESNASRRDKPCQTCSCGLAMNNVQDNGASIYPWLAALTKNGTYICFGSLINDRYILTAASCIWNKNATGSPLKEIKILFTTYNQSQPGQQNDLAAIEEIKVHPDFKPNSLDSDIALLKLGAPVKYRVGLSPICLPEENWNFIGRWGTVVGVGPGHGPYNKLNLVKYRLPIITYGYCLNPYYGYYPNMKPKITKNMLCVSSWDLPYCLNGTGGPLMVGVAPGLIQIVGIASWGNDCGEPAKPGVYTKTGEFLKWIAENTADACYCGYL